MQSNEEYHVPDMVGHVIGWKFLTVADDGVNKPRLMSPTVSFDWSQGAMKAKCILKTHNPECQVAHAGDLNGYMRCACGFYLSMCPEVLRAYFVAAAMDTPNWPVLVRVKGWGAVTEGSLGFRVSHASIDRIFVPDFNSRHVGALQWMPFSPGRTGPAWMGYLGGPLTSYYTARKGLETLGFTENVHRMEVAVSSGWPTKSAEYIRRVMEGAGDKTAKWERERIFGGYAGTRLTNTNVAGVIDTWKPNKRDRMSNVRSHNEVEVTRFGTPAYMTHQQYLSYRPSVNYNTFIGWSE